jgi:chorismate--pyruvate lyase
MRRWLMASGSLSARLAHTGSVFSVQVLGQGRAPLRADEAGALGLGALRVGYTREVLLRVDGQPVVFARSVTAHHHADGAWRAVQGLGTRPLADVLFRRSGIARQPLSYKRFQRGSPMQRHVIRAWSGGTGAQVFDTALRARRSVFLRQGAALLVMEVFVAQATRWTGLALDHSTHSVWKELS